MPRQRNTTRDAQITELWGRGLSGGEIGQRIGMRRESVLRIVSELRAQGIHLERRPHWGHKSGQAEAITKLRTKGLTYNQICDSLNISFGAVAGVLYRHHRSAA